MTTNYASASKTALIKIEIEEEQDLAQILALVGRDEEFSKSFGNGDDYKSILFWLKSVSAYDSKATVLRELAYASGYVDIDLPFILNLKEESMSFFS